MGGGRAGRVVGANLRVLRERRGLSLSELARRSGIAKGTLSQLEAGAGNPTIETVFSLSSTLEVPVSSLLSGSVSDEVVVVRSVGVEVLSGAVVDLRLLRRLGGDRMVLEVYDQRIRPGGVQRSEGHSGSEHVVVTAGVLRVGPVDRPYVLEAGDYLCFPGHLPHSYEAVDGSVSSVLLLQYPVGLTGSTFHE